MSTESADRAESKRPRAQDAGLQAQRTALSWNRTGLAIFANALLALRSGWTNRDVPVTALALVLLLAAGAVMAYGAWRRQQMLSSVHSIAAPALPMAAVGVIALMACATGVASLFAPPTSNQ